MANVVVVGAQWGDEGKGKIVDWLSERADIVVRFQGGHNAGHTLVIDGVSYKLSLLPSGVARPGKLSVIGNGVVVDPWAFVDEIARLRAQGVPVTPESLLLAENAALILPVHRDLDVSRETAASAGQAIGTTRRGIGPAYEDVSGAARSGWSISPILRRCRPRSSGFSPTTTRSAAAWAWRRSDAEELVAALRAVAPEMSAIRWLGMAAPRRSATRRQAHPVRGRAGRAARCRSWHLSVRHFVQHRCRPGGRRLRHRAAGDRLRAWHRQGIHDAGGRGAVPDRGQGANGRAARRTRATNSGP